MKMKWMAAPVIILLILIVGGTSAAQQQGKPKPAPTAQAPANSDDGPSLDVTLNHAIELCGGKKSRPVPPPPF
jgi:hypothetical protein